MLCDNCQKEKASLHYTEVINNSLTEIHLCMSCAQKKGLDDSFSLSFANLFTDLSSDLSEVGDIKISSKKKEGCKCCGLTLNDFKKLGLFGCSECYETFSAKIENILQKIHGATHHTGKMPRHISKEISSKREIIKLREKLQKTIKLEKYEEAAKIRDKLKKLEGII
ncbi:UvrB/UvrC motif-containing protein [bacterium]|nr:UvrB/UvrC motif-containing protein [bacterium]MBU1152701.1 UvrB/UvrC motif-containing protein [bacterium]